MTDDETQKTASGGPDWAKLASAALDLWQDHLTSLANDEKAKEEMARMIAPMSQMFVNWTDMVQQTLQGMNADVTATKPSDGPVSSESPAADGPVVSEPAGRESVEPVRADPVAESSAQRSSEPASDAEPAESSDSAVSPARGGFASTDRARDLSQLAGRLAELERELDGLRARKRKAGESESEPSAESDHAFVAQTGSLPVSK